MTRTTRDAEAEHSVMTDDQRDRYSGKYGRENYLDDYVFGPLFLSLIVVGSAYVGNVLFAFPGLIAGLVTGVLLDYWLVKKEWEMRKND